MLRTSLRFAAPATITLSIAPKKEFLIHAAGKDNLPALRTSITVDSARVLQHYSDLTMYRRMETMCDQCYKGKKIRGFCHLYIGQEAIAQGMQESLTMEDSIVTGYRDHVWYLVRGGKPADVFAEMMGRQTGCSKGKGGSMHMYHQKNNFYGGNGIVGAQGALGTGLAWKYSLTNGVNTPKNVAVALYGDGAANQGQLFECYNMASLYKIPVIFVCENNHFGMGTSEARGSANPSFYKRCEYIPGLRVDGMDIFAVQEATRWAKEWCTTGNGPVILEMDSYRYVGHSMSDPDSAYRTKDDIRKVRDERDCIVYLKKVILDNGIATEAQLKDIDKEQKKYVEEQLVQAEAAPLTNENEIWTDIYAANTPGQGIRTTQGTVFA